VARLESTAKAGFYPTPDRVAVAIAALLAATPSGARRTVRLLDPCAGRGAAAATIGRALGAETFGVELNEERAAAARDCLDHVLCASAFAVRLAHGAFSCLMLNPPYSEDSEHGRLEHAFLTALTRALCANGLLILLIPQVRLAVSARYLASHYSGFAAYRFPDPEYASFRQLALFATRKAQPLADATAQARLEVWSRGELLALPDVPDGAPLFPAPTLPAGDILFGSLFFDPQQAAAEAWRRGVWTQPHVAEQLWPPDERPVQPLMPLRRGHLALLIAAGLLDNVALEADGRRVLVKGRTRKVFVERESSDPDTSVERETLETSVVVLDLRTGALERVEQGGVAATGRAA
jgi:predicted RNA methylase